METPKEWRAHEKYWLNLLLRQHPNDIKKYIAHQKELYMCLANNPEMAKQALLRDANFHIRQSQKYWKTELRLDQPYQCISQEFTQILERVEYNKTLFRFIIGKLADHPAVRDVIFKEIASMIIQHSFDPDMSGILPINEMLSYIMDLKHESFPEDVIDNMGELEDPSLITPALIYLRWTMKFSNVECLEPDTPCALKVVGAKADISEFLPKVISNIKHLRNVCVVELESLDKLNQGEDHSSAYQEFSTMLYKSECLVSMELNSLDPKLTRILTETLPLSVQRLSVGSDPCRETQRGTYSFPPEVHLVSLLLDNCLSKVNDLFRNTNFPNLKKISLKNDSYGWEGKEPLIVSREDAQSLLDAVRSGRMPVLEELSIRDCCLKGCGPELVEIIKSKSFRTAQFVGTTLNTEDGQIFLKNIQDGNLNHLELLNLLDNEKISLLKNDFELSCHHHEISLEMNASQIDLIEENARNDVASSVLESSLSSFSTEQRHSMMTLFFSFTPYQKHTAETLFCSLTADQAQIISTAIENIFQNESRLTAQLQSPENTAREDTANDVASPLAMLVCGVIKERVERGAAEVVKRIASSVNPEQTMNMMTLFSSFTPEQVQMMKTLISNLSSEQSQTVKNLISNFTPEQVHIVKVLLSEEKQNQSSSGEQLENSTNEAPQRLYDFSDICNNVSRFFNKDNSAKRNKPQEPTEDSKQDDREQKRGDYKDDLDLD